MRTLDLGANHHEKTIPHNVLWGFSASDFSEISFADIRELIRSAKKYEHLRPGGKTAMVFFHKADYGKGRMIEIHSDIENLKFSTKPFYTREEAVTWLGAP